MAPSKGTSAEDTMGLTLRRFWILSPEIYRRRSLSPTWATQIGYPRERMSRKKPLLSMAVGRYSLL